MSTQTYEPLKGNENPVTMPQISPATDFKNVSSGLLSKTISFDEAIERLTKGRAETQDIELPLESISFEQEDSELLVNLDGNKVRPTDLALRQLANKLGIPSKILTNWSQGDEEDLEVCVDILKNGQRRVLAGEVAEEGQDETEVDNWLFRTRVDGTLRAALSSKFLKLDNLWFLESLKNILPEGRIVGYNKCDGADTIYGNIIIPDSLRVEKDSNYGGGSGFQNSEVGLRSCGVSPFLYRGICTNSVIYGKVKGISFMRKHLGTKIDYDKQFQSLKDCITKQIPLVAEHIDALLNTRTLAWSESSRKLMAQATIELGLTKKQGTMLLEAYELEPELSCFGLINAITRASQKMPSEVWIACDSYAGLLTNETVWGFYSAKAKALTSKDVESCFATVS